MNPRTDEICSLRLFSTTTAALIGVFLEELRQKHDVETAALLVNGAKHLRTVCQRARLRFQTKRHGNRNTIERVSKEVKRRTPSFSNYSSYVGPATAEDRLQSFARWHDAPKKHDRITAAGVCGF